jgi:hypothetical protein
VHALSAIALAGPSSHQSVRLSFHPSICHHTGCFAAALLWQHGRRHQRAHLSVSPPLAAMDGGTSAHICLSAHFWLHGRRHQRVHLSVSPPLNAMDGGASAHICLSAHLWLHGRLHQRAHLSVSPPLAAWTAAPARASVCQPTFGCMDGCTSARISRRKRWLSPGIALPPPQGRMFSRAICGTGKCRPQRSNCSLSKPALSRIDNAVPLTFKSLLLGCQGPILMASGARV